MVSQATAVPVISLCLNEVSKAVTKSANDPNDMVVPEIQEVWKVVAQITADPLVMYKRVKAIFFLLVSYTALFTTR